ADAQRHRRYRVYGREKCQGVRVTVEHGDHRARAIPRENLAEDPRVCGDSLSAPRLQCLEDQSWAGYAHDIGFDPDGGETFVRVDYLRDHRARSNQCHAWFFGPA